MWLKKKLTKKQHCHILFHLSWCYTSLFSLFCLEKQKCRSQKKDDACLLDDSRCRWIGLHVWVQTSRVKLMFLVSTAADAAASPVAFLTRLGVRCLENPSSAVGVEDGWGWRGRWDQTKCKLLGASSTSWWTTPYPFALQNWACWRGKRKEEKKKDVSGATPTVSQRRRHRLERPASGCQFIFTARWHADVCRVAQSFLYFLNKIRDAPSSSSSQALSPTMQFFHFHQSLCRPRPFPQRWLVRSACHYTVTLQMERGIHVIKTKMQGHNS